MKDHLLRSSAKVKVIVRSLSFEGQGLGDTHNKKVLSHETVYDILLQDLQFGQFYHCDCMIYRHYLLN